MIKFISDLLIQLVIWYLNYRWNSRFQEIKTKTGILNTQGAGASLTVLFNHIRNAYQVELDRKGLVGLLKLRKSVSSQINDLNISNIWHKDKSYNEAELQNSLKHLYMFKDILSNIKYNVEMLMGIKTILSFISNAAFIPLFVVSFLFLVRKVFIGFSVLFSLLFTGTYASVYVKQKYEEEVHTYMENITFIYL